MWRCRCHPSSMPQGMVVGASTIARDVTERRRQTEKLRENEARLRLALRSARAGAWDFDLRRRELHWSPEMFALYGLDPAKGQPSREMLAQRISPGPPQARAQGIRQRHAAGRLLHPRISHHRGRTARRSGPRSPAT